MGLLERLPGRQRLGALALLVYAVVGMGMHLKRQATSRRPPRPKVQSGLTAEQIARLRSALPARTGVMSEALGSEALTLDPRWVWTQYDLAPIQLVPAADARVVLLRVSDPSSAAELSSKRGFLVREDLGRGVFVLERRP
jgi:hypothetical protein